MTEKKNKTKKNRLIDLASKRTSTRHRFDQAFLIFHYIFKNHISPGFRKRASLSNDIIIYTCICVYILRIKMKRWGCAPMVYINALKLVYIILYIYSGELLNGHRVTSVKRTKKKIMLKNNLRLMKLLQKISPWKHALPGGTRSRLLHIYRGTPSHRGNGNKRVIRSDLGGLPRRTNSPPWPTTYDYVLKNTYSVLRVRRPIPLSWAQEMRASLRRHAFESYHIPGVYYISTHDNMWFVVSLLCVV